MVTTPDHGDDGQHPDRPDPEEPMIDADRVAAIMGGDITAGTVKRRYKHWELTAYRVGRELRWKESEVREWINKRRVN